MAQRSSARVNPNPAEPDSVDVPRADDNPVCVVRGIRMRHEQPLLATEYLGSALRSAMGALMNTLRLVIWN